jgi:hypothetical protein
LERDILIYPSHPIHSNLLDYHEGLRDPPSV